MDALQLVTIVLCAVAVIVGIIGFIRIKLFSANGISFGIGNLKVGLDTLLVMAVLFLIAIVLHTVRDFI